MKYKPEVDVLRAVAILLALFFHAGFGFASRGYVSLDIFFVISGYMMTQQIAEGLDKRKFSLIGFYERRMRRLLPALFAVLVLTLIVGGLLLPPYEMSRLALSATSVTLFYSNFFFQNEGWYFDTASHLKPLLHLWSLSVEEQFYFLYPIVFMFSARWGQKNIVRVISLLALVSFGYYLADFLQLTQISFYQLTWRAWELLLGALTCLLWTRVNAVVFLQKWRAWLYSLGLALIFLSVFLFHPAIDPFLNQSWTRIYTALGTAMVIMFMPVYTGFISWPKNILVQLGLISYGTYLWHQPLFAFYRIYVFGKSQPEVLLLLIVLSFVLGYLSWRFIETPIRRSQLLTTRKVYLYSFVMTFLIAAVSFGIYKSEGFPQRLSAKVRSELKEIEDSRSARFTQTKLGVCHFNRNIISLDEFLKKWNCYADDESDGSKKIPVAVTGDSLSSDIVVGLRSNGLNPLQLAGAGCAVAPALMTSECRAIADRLLNELKSHPEYKAIILVADFREDYDLELLGQAIQYWKKSGLKIVFMTGNFSFPFFNHKIVRGLDPTFDQVHANESMRPELLQYLRANDIYVVDSRYYFCAINECRVRDREGHFLMFDERHLTLGGSKQYLEIMLKQEPFFKSLVN